MDKTKLTIKLKPCPFCGRTDKLQVNEYAMETLFSISCQCGCDAPNDSTSANGAARIWNRRRGEN